MIKPNVTTQQKILDFINTLPDDADISVPMFYHLITGRTYVINKTLHKLCLKGILEFSHSKPTGRGGQPMNIYKKVATPENTEFEFGLIKEGVFADLFIKPYPCNSATEVRLLTGCDEEEDDDGKQ